MYSATTQGRKRVKWDAENRNNEARPKKAELIDLPRAKGCIMADRYVARRIHRNYTDVLEFRTYFSGVIFRHNSGELEIMFFEIPPVKVWIIIECNEDLVQQEN